MKCKYSIPRLMLIFIVGILSSKIWLLMISLSVEIAYIFTNAYFVLWLCVLWLILIMWAWHFKIIEMYLEFILIKTKLIDKRDITKGDGR